MGQLLHWWVQEVEGDTAAAVEAPWEMGKGHLVQLVQEVLQILSYLSMWKCNQEV